MIRTVIIKTVGKRAESKTIQIIIKNKLIGREGLRTGKIVGNRIIVFIIIAICESSPKPKAYFFMLYIPHAINKSMSVKNNSHAPSA